MTITLAGGFAGGVSTTVGGAATTGTRTTTGGNFIVSAFSDQNAAATAWATTVATAQNLTVIGRRLATGDSIDCAYLPNITGHVGDAVTANSGSQFKSCSAGEFAGVKTTSPLDASATTGGSSGAYTSGTTFSCPTVTTTVAGDLVVGVATIETGVSGTFSGVGSWAVASSYGDGSVSSTSVLVWQVVGAPGNYTPQFTFNQSGTASIGQTFAFFDATGATAPAYPVGPKQRTRRALPKPRTRWVRPVPPQVNPPILPPRPTQHRTWATVTRRGHVATPIPPQFNPPILPPRPTQHRTWPTLLRRGHRIQPVPPQQNPIIAPPVANQARRLRGWPVRRGRTVTPVPTQQALPTNPPYATVGNQRRLRAGWLRRGRQTTPLPVQTAPPPLSATTRRRLSPPTLRRSRRSDVVGYQDTPQPVQGHRGPRLGRLRQRRPQTVPAPTVVLPNPVLPTKTATIRRLAGWALRRGRKAEQGWPQGLIVTDPYLLENFTTIFSTNDTVLSLSDSGQTKVSYTDPTTLTVLDQTAEYDHVDDQGGTKD